MVPRSTSRPWPRVLRRVAFGVAVLASAATVGLPVAASGAPPAAAPGAPGLPSTWAPGDKDGFGTARTLASKVWYTLNDGTLTDVFFPRVDTPALRDAQFVVSDGRTFADREDTDTIHEVRLVDPRSLVYRQIDTGRTGRYRITKTYVTDPARSAVLVDVTFESLSGRPYQVYLLHDVGLGLNGNDDAGTSHGQTLLASDTDVSVAVRGNPGFTQTSSGYLGASDGWTDLRSDFAMDWSFVAPQPGNVVQLARTRLTGLAGAQHMTVAFGFGGTAAAATGTVGAALDGGFRAALAGYEGGWHRYLDGLRAPPASVGSARTTYDVSVMVLAASEDKTFRGGFVAAPTRPWAWGNDLQTTPVYIAVWSRDLYEMATALIAAGDTAAASRALDYLFGVQQRADGSFPDNSRLSGETVFGGLEIDEVAFPIVLDWQLGRFGALDWAHVRGAADFIVANGPQTVQERWENQAGYSPASIAAEIAGLVCAADIAKRNGAPSLAAHYLAVADDWRQNLDRWTVTHSGPLSTAPYYLRVTAGGNAEAGTQIQLSDGGPLIDQRQVVDPSFLELVRLGVVRADDPDVRSTLPVIDANLGFHTPNGQFWHRASFDGYGEARDGSQWRLTDPGSDLTLGRGWPLLTGERGEYALVAGQPAGSFLQTMANAADPQSHFIAEQVWDDRAPAGSGPRFQPGTDSTSATPLDWSHGQFIRLAWSIQAGTPVETPRVVACRYASETCGR